MFIVSANKLFNEVGLHCETIVGSSEDMLDGPDSRSLAMVSPQPKEYYVKRNLTRLCDGFATATASTRDSSIDFQPF